MAMDTLSLSTATALEIASCELLRPVRKMYLFHFSPVMESATAGTAAMEAAKAASATHVRRCMSCLLVGLQTMSACAGSVPAVPGLDSKRFSRRGGLTVF